MPKTQPLPFLILLILLLACDHTHAQSHSDKKELPLELLSIDEGLSQGMVNCVAQDHYGFLWFGTKDGLNRYDGQRFIVYRNIPSDSGSLNDNYVQAIYEDSRKRLWIGTSREGLELFNRETETFHHIRLDSTRNSLSNCVIRMQEDNDHNLWVGTFNGLYKITFNEPATVTTPALFPPLYTIKKYFERSCNFLITKSGTIYGTSTWRYPFIIHPAKNGRDQIVPLDPANYYWVPSNTNDLLKYTSVVVEDSVRKKIYFLYEYSFVEVDQLTMAPKIIFRRPPPSATLPYAAIIDKEGLLWVTTSGYMEQFNPRTGAIRCLTARDNDLKPAARQVRNIYTCRSGIMWIGTMGFGILKYNPATEKFHTINGYSMSWMFPANDGKIICQTQSAFLGLLDPAKRTYSITVTDSAYGAIKKMRLIRPTYAAVQDKQGIFWVNRESLVRFDPVKFTFDTINNHGINGVPVFLDSDTVLWYSSGGAFSAYNTITQTFRHWKFPFEINNDPYFYVQAIYRDANKNFWLGTNNGLLFYNPFTNAWKNYSKDGANKKSLNNNIVFSVQPDPAKPERYLWLGTNGGGLNRLDIQTGEFINYTEQDGLSNNVVYGILTDNSNRLWLSTNRGLSRFDVKEKTFRNFDVRDGLQGNEFNRHAWCKDERGWMYFGGMNGVNYFHPDSITDNAVRPDIVITAIRLKNKAISFNNKKSPLSKPTYLESRIEIPYNENMIAFDFAALEFSAPRKNQYMYRMNGFDQEWILSGNNPSAIYTNLDPGEYTFVVKGSNNDGIWSDKEARMSVLILAPWYMTWWFRISIFTLLAAGIYQLYRYRMNQTIRVQELRNRIASDLHDEIGSTLSSISLYGEATKQLVSNNPEAMKMLSRINDNTQQMMEAMSDIVWTINTRHDRFDEMMSRMREYAVHAIEVRNGEVHFNEVPEISQITLDMNQRKNIYLIFKEAVNNAAKYSECKNLYVEFHFKKWGCIIKIRDDGKGFNPDHVKKGNGLYNMYKRTAAIKGDLGIHSIPGNGTEVVLKVIF